MSFTKMRVLLMTYGSRGDIEPMTGLALGLRKLGVDVRMCAPPDFADLLDGLGLPLVPIGESVRPVMKDTLTKQAPMTAEALAARAEALIGTAYDAVSEAARGCDVVVATGLMPTASAARSVAEKLGIGYVWAAYFASYLESPHHRPCEYPVKPFPPDVTDNQALWDLDAENMNALFGTGLNAHRARVGLPRVGHFRDYVVTDRPLLAADPVLSPWPTPAALGVVQTGAWFRPDDRPLPAELEAFLDAGAPPVYVGFGSMPMRDAAGVARAAVEAVRAQGRRVLLSGGWADLDLVDDEDDCFAVGEVNHHALFRRVAAVVHHGGAGTTTTAARAGAPQVAVPQIGDQSYWAGRVAALGIGAAHDGPTPTFASLSAALTPALAYGTRARATAVAGTIRTDGAEVAARWLIDSA